MGALPPSVQPNIPLAPVLSNPFFEDQNPTTYVLIDGLRFTPVAWSIESNAHGATDTATLTLPISNGPDWTQTIYRGDDAGNADQPVYVKIYAGLTTPRLRFWGIVDLYTARLTGDEDGDRITFQCRSLGAPLLTTKITTPFAGQQSTTAQFVAQQAARFGLNTQILVSSPLTIQQVLGHEFATGVHSITIWELMLQCAVQDGVDIWVDQNTLWYASPDLIARTTIDLAWLRDIKSIDCSHATQFAKNVRVEVRSYRKRVRTSTYARYQTGPDGSSVLEQSGSRVVTSSPVFGTNQSVSTTVSSSGSTTTTVSTLTGGSASGSAGVPAGESGKELYTFYFPNKSQSDCATLAKILWQRISQHEFAISIELPVTAAKLALMGKTALLNLHGLPYAYFNAQYWPRRITETFDTSSGWNWAIDAINHQGPNGEA